jgi:hypothetical protein
MNSYIFETILIIFIIIVIWHLVYNKSLLIKSKSISDNESNEHMNNITDDSNDSNDLNSNDTGYSESQFREDNTSGIDRTSDNMNWYHIANKIDKNKKNNLIFNDNYDGNLSSDPFDANEFKITSKYYPKSKLNNKVKAFNQAFNQIYTDVYGNENTMGQSDIDVKEYIRNVVLNGNADCECVVDKSQSTGDLFTRKEIDEYREQALQFHSKINGSSAPTEDPTDRMNLINLKEGIKAKGQTIADVYDTIIGGQVSNQSTQSHQYMNTSIAPIQFQSDQMIGDNYNNMVGAINSFDDI